jgi:protein SCO1/2
VTVGRTERHDHDLTDDERRAAFAAPPPRVSRRTLTTIAAACLLLAGGGAIADHFLGGPVAGSSAGAGTTPPPLDSNTTTASTAPQPAQAATPSHPGVPTATAAMMSLSALHPSAAPPFRLVGPTGKPIGLEAFRGRIVVLSFFDSRCDDLCTVVEQELAGARSILQATGFASRCVFVTINTDPLAASLASERPALSGPLSASAASSAASTKGGGTGWYFLTAPLHVLDSVWTSYGVTVDAQPSSGTVSHTDLIDFVSPTGELVARATPFGNQVGRARYALGASATTQFATGIADEVTHLVGQQTADR